jgi:glutaredoxin
MAGWKRWIDRARNLAEQAVPDEVRDAGRRLRDRVIETAPAPIAAALERITARGEADADPPGVEPPTASAEPVVEAIVPVPVEDPAVVLARVKAKAERGLKPEDSLVVVYATGREREDADRIVALFDGIDTTVRVMDLDREPQTKRQMASLTDVMVPPYVFINGRYWGGPYEMEALLATGDLPKVVVNLLDEIGPEARRIGKLRESFSDELTVANIVSRWRLGHILCVDDLDAWFELDRDGRERFFYQGGERPPAQMEAIAGEIVAAVDAGDIEAQWLLDPVIHVH